MISCHRGSEARKDPGGAIVGDLQDRPASITNIESALGIKGETSGNPKLGGKGDSRTLLVHAVDRAFMATTNIQSAIRSKGQARRIRNVRRQGHDLAFWRYAVERDWHVLVFRPADRRIDVPLRVHSGARHRMQIVSEPRRNRKRHRIALPLALDNMDMTDVSTLCDDTKQQSGRRQHRTRRAGAKHDTTGRQCLGLQARTGQGDMPTAYTSLRGHSMECNSLRHSGCVNAYRIFVRNRQQETTLEIIPWGLRQEQRFLQVRGEMASPQ